MEKPTNVDEYLANNEKYGHLLPFGMLSFM